VVFIFFVAGIIFLIRDLLDQSSVWPVIEIALVVGLGISAALLWIGKFCTLTQLRFVELAIFGSIAAYLAAHDYHLVYLEVIQDNGGLVLGRSVHALLHYAVLVAAYGIFIPNTWQRSAALTVPMALTPLGTGFLLNVRHPEFLEVASEVGFIAKITDPMLLLMVSVVIAVYGTHVIHQVRSEAFDTRNMGFYQLKERIGAGGMGEVWLAEHRLLTRPAAMKLIRPDRLGNGGDERAHHLVRRFEREAQATASLRSPHTVELYDFGVTADGAFYYVMEYLDGLDLDTLVKTHGPISPDRTSYLLRQACLSLGDAHSQGLIHRDIKPGNIYVCRMGLNYDFIKVLDFGLVKSENSGDELTKDLTMEGVTTGTPAYMAPEMVLGKEQVDARTDLYALGAVAYWLVTGQLVFEQDTPMAMVVDHVKTEPIPPSQRTELEIPESLDRIILKCLAKDPAQRFQSAMELEAELAASSGPNGWDAKNAEKWWQLHRPS
jgi:serine/threonine-protein kinase